MTKPDWEVAWFRDNPYSVVDRSDRKTGYEQGYLAATAQNEADIARAKRGWLEQIKARAKQLDNSERNADWSDCIRQALEEAEEAILSAPNNGETT